MLPCIDVYFVPTFINIGRNDSNGIEVDRPIFILPVGNGLVKAFTHLRDSAGNKITFMQGIFKLLILISRYDNDCSNGTGNK